MYRDVLDRKQIISRMRKACENVDRVVSSGNAYTTLGNHRDPVQTLLMRRSSGDGIIMPMIESAAIDAELKSAGSGEIFLKMVAKYLSSDLRNEDIKLIDSEWLDILDHVKTHSTPARKRDIANILPKSDVFSNVIRKTFDEIRCGDRVIVKKSPTNSTSISRSSGFVFSGLNIDKRFHSKGLWSKKNCRIILIDGVIENISEIHRLLEDLSKSRQPAIIVCIDALPDVCETLAKNYEIGNLEVILIKIPIDETHINSLVDMGVITQIPPVSAGRGETISQGCLRQTFIANRVNVLRDQIVIEDDKSHREINKHIEELRKRIDDNRELQIILEPRILSMCGASIQINVGIDDLKRDPNIVEKLDRFFRMIPKILNFGIINKKDLSRFSSDKVCLLFGEQDAASSATISKSIEIFLSIKKSIGSSGAAIESV